MERVRFIDYLGIQILLIDCSHCAPHELTSVFNQVQQVVTSQPPGSVLTLADFTDAEFDKKAADHLKVVATYDRSHVKRSAIVGADSLPDVYYRNLVAFSAREFPVFKTREEAMDWLVDGQAKRVAG
ncbi:MAG: hypothetical protein ACXVZZ_13435 [Terriglobales bacterium]